MVGRARVKIESKLFFTNIIMCIYIHLYSRYIAVRETDRDKETETYADRDRQRQIDRDMVIKW